MTWAHAAALVEWDGRGRDGDILPRTKAGVELIFVEEQQALARAVLVYLDVPGPQRGPSPAHLKDAISWHARDAARQVVRTLLGQTFYRYLLPLLFGC